MANGATSIWKRRFRKRRGSVWRAWSFWSSEAYRMVKTQIRCAGGSDAGRVRRNNEDAWHADPDRGIFVVVDGIGGQAAGEKAAQIAIDRVSARGERPR